ncbi:hypothetical protein WP3W18E02_25730 [Klebsiella sp. WP3-W18-ESBL-02]|nr:hypothetical protein WP3W18E02_25730 [Klebsiella sp. WP3-W18-ESBL-02]BBR20998.1 hypothetical protein WP3S18E05_24780 [Klebsiella sp. WP3-S18-ESBL-05]
MPYQLQINLEVSNQHIDFSEDNDNVAIRSSVCGFIDIPLSRNCSKGGTVRNIASVARNETPTPSGLCHDCVNLMVNGYRHHKSMRRTGPQVNLTPRFVAISSVGHAYATICSIACNIRLSEIGYGVPSCCAKKLTRSSSIIQRISFTSSSSRRAGGSLFSHCCHAC